MLKKIAILLSLLVLLSSGTSAEYGVLGDGKLQHENSQVTGPGGDMTTVTFGPLTFYLHVRGWPEMFVDPLNPEGYLVEAGTGPGAVLYNAGLLGSGSAKIMKREVLQDSERTTVRLRVRLKYTTYSEDPMQPPKTHKKTVWISQSIKTPRTFTYPKTANVSVERYPWGDTVNSSAAFNEGYGFFITAYAPKQSFEEVLKDLQPDNEQPEEESKIVRVSAKLSKISRYYDIYWDPDRRINYGQLIFLDSPEVRASWANMLYNNTPNPSVTGVVFPANSTIEEVRVLTPWGERPIDLVAEVEEKTNKEATRKDLIFFVGFILLIILIRKNTKRRYD